MVLCLEAAFMEPTVASTIQRGGPASERQWPDMDILPLISDREYLRRRSLSVTLFGEPDLRGNRTQLGSGSLPLDVLVDVAGAAVEFFIGLRAEEEPVARISGFANLIFFDSFKPL